MVEEVKRELFRKGGTAGDWAAAVTSGLAASDLVWVNAASAGDEALAFARQVMQQGNLVEYECCDSRGSPQGRAVIRLKDWADYGEGFLRADHIIASDGYYEWYATHDLQRSGAVYHVCGEARRKCKAKLPRGDRSVVIHMEKWRLLTPLQMLDSPYTARLGMAAIKEWVKNFTPQVPEPAAPPVGPGGQRGVNDPTGVDQALADLPRVEAAVGAEAAKEPRSEAVKARPVPKGSVGLLLEQKAAAFREGQREKEDKRRKGERERGRSRSRRRRRSEKEKRGGASSGDRSGSRSSRSSQDFRQPSTRGESSELWRLSKKNPGKLFREG
eukprot:Skav217100  [mRNA]  locus=scaffold139:22442:23425:+ [translate_table: standard]